MATHDDGELNCPLRRTALILDLEVAYNCSRNTQRWALRFFAEG